MVLEASQALSLDMYKYEFKISGYVDALHVFGYSQFVEQRRETLILM